MAPLSTTAEEFLEGKILELKSHVAKHKGTRNRAEVEARMARTKIEYFTMALQYAELQYDELKENHE